MLILDLIGYPPTLLETLIVVSVAIVFAFITRRYPSALSALFALFTSCAIIAASIAANGENLFDLNNFLTHLFGYMLGKLFLLYIISFMIIYLSRSLVYRQKRTRIFSRK